MTEYNPGTPSNSTYCRSGGGPTACAHTSERDLQLTRQELERQGAMLQRLQRELVLAQERYQRLYQETPLGFVTLDAQGWICELNRAAAALLGEPPAALVGRPLAGFLAADDRHHFLCHLRAALQMRREVVSEVRLNYEKPSETVVELTLTPQGLGSSSGLQVTMVDLTASRRTEEALRQSEARYDATIEIAAVGIAHIALDGSWLYVNPRFCEVVGYAEQELKQRSFQELIHPEDRPVQANYFSALTQGTLRRYSQEKRLLHQDGHSVWVDAGAVVQRDGDGLPQYTIHVVQDISDRKQAETHLKSFVESHATWADRRSRRLRELAAALTEAEQRERRQLAQLLHDHLQQHLVAMRLRINSLCRHTQDEKLLNGLREIDGLLNESIDASRGLTYELSPPILQDAGLNAALVWLARWTEEKHGLAVEVVTDPNAEPRERTQRLLLFLGVRELLFNVVKHAQTSRARVEVSLQDEQVQVVVSDQGVGFDLARQGWPLAGTSGFGLSSVRERLGWLGGRMEIESAPGCGTRITMQVPHSGSAVAVE